MTGVQTCALPISVPVDGFEPKPVVGVVPNPELLELLELHVDPNPVDGVVVALPNPPDDGAVDVEPNPLVDVCPAGNGAGATVVVALD